MRSRNLQTFIREIQFANRNPRDNKVLESIQDISTNPERVIETKAKLYRCRIITDDKRIHSEPGFYGYNASESFVPPVRVTKDLRANYRYIPYLYCANHPYLALVEVRPRLGAHVSMATIVVNESIRLLDFTVQKKPNRMSEAKQNLFSDLSELYSKPIANDDDIFDYIPTQYIAEYAKNLGYDGICFTSSLTPEINGQNMDRFNVVVFNYDKCTVIKSNVFAVTTSYIECQQIDEDEQQLDIHLPPLDNLF